MLRHVYDRYIVAACCSVLQRVAACCSVFARCNVLQCVCSVYLLVCRDVCVRDTLLQCVVVCCSVFVV